MKSNDKYGIYFVVFICGASLMVLEIIGSRLLAPYYGDTIYLWGSIIGIFLLALSAGYYLGGILADRKPYIWILSILIDLTGFWILFLPSIHTTLISLFSGLEFRVQTLASVLALFFFPSLLLGMVSPYMIKFKLKTLKKTGIVSGKLYAVSTLGSVVGTFSATFILILFFSVTKIFLLLGLTLILTSLTLKKRKLKEMLLPLMFFCLFFFLIIPEIQHTEDNLNSSFSDYVNLTIESYYGNLKVYDTKDVRNLRVGRARQSAINKSNVMQYVSGFTYLEVLETPYKLKDIKDTLVLGCGGGLYPRIVWKKYKTNMDCIELDDKIIEVSKKYFGLEETKTFHIYNSDARVYLLKNIKTYDLIVVDTFRFEPSTGRVIIPFHLVTNEFFTLAKKRLKPEGMLIINYVGDWNKEYLESQYKTIKNVYPSVYVIQVGQNFGATAIIASPEEIGEKNMEKAIKYKELTTRLFVPETKDAIVLTDDYAPINPFRQIGVFSDWEDT